MFICKAHHYCVLYDGDTFLFGVSQFFYSLVGLHHLGVVIVQVVFNVNALLFDQFLFRFLHDVSDLCVHLFLYLSFPSVSHFLFFNSRLLSHRLRMSQMTHGFFMR